MLAPLAFVPVIDVIVKFTDLSDISFRNHIDYLQLSLLVNNFGDTRIWFSNPNRHGTGRSKFATFTDYVVLVTRNY